MRSKDIAARARALLAREVGFVQKPAAGRLRVALAFPNTYYVGMSNLGFQTVYRLFNALDHVSCERVFLPPRQELAEQVARRLPLLTLESQSPVADFDVLAFSVSFEWDYTNVVTMLRLAGLPVYASERDGRHPLVVIGGAVTFLNPEPLAPFADLIAAGEGEQLIPDLVAVAGAGGSRSTRLRAIAGRRGFYVPSLYEPAYRDDGTLSDVKVMAEGVPATVQKAAVKATELVDPRTPRSSPRTRSSGPVSWWKSFAGAPISAGSAGRATTTCP